MLNVVKQESHIIIGGGDGRIIIIIIIISSIILPVALYGCEIWSLTVREEHKLRVFENRALRRIFGPKRG
jgi:hypothetical protein